MDSHESKDTLETRVVKTIAYYRALERMALTASEVRKYMQKEKDFPSLFDVNETLNKLLHYGTLEHKNGFWVLKNDGDLADARVNNMKNTSLKWKIFMKTGRFLPYMPYIRGVAVTGSVALSNSSKNSDIDVLVFCKKGHIWTTRFIVTTISFLLGRRRYGKKVKNRLCFNQYITDKAEKLGPENIDNVVKSMHAPAWKHNAPTKNECLFSLKPSKYILGFKHAAELFMKLTLLGALFERLLGNAQINKIKNNPLGYPSELGELSLSTNNLIFYYPKVQETEKEYHSILKNMSA